MRYLTLSLILFAGTVQAKEWFHCQAGNFWSDGADVVVTLTVNDDGETATIKVAGITHDAWYKVYGFNRRWNFGIAADGSFDYGSIIEPDGRAAYFDFSRAEIGENTDSVANYICKQG